jgi:uncharacterized membrane protein YdjX (TVP38/TMEM64 family)
MPARLVRMTQVLGDREALERVLDDLGPWGPLYVVLAEATQVLLAPIPGQVVGLVSGYAYGFVWGTLLCTIGLALGTLMAVWLARRLGRPLVERFVSAAWIRRIDSYVERRGALVLFLIFLVPFLPDDLCCLVAGLTSLRITHVVLLAVVGRTPGLVISTLMGAQAHRMTWPQLAIIASVGVALALVYARSQRRLEAAMVRFIERLMGM